MENFSAYLSSVTSGTLYEEVISRSGSKLSREEMKRKIQPVFFSRNEIHGFIPYEKDKKLFADAFPTVYECIQLLKKKGS